MDKKCVIVGVTGGIAAYKICSLVSSLKKKGHDVHVLMTENATNFINPITFETLTGNKCLVDTFDRNFEFSVEHVSLAKQADVVLVAPATANVIAKLAHGLADDMLTTTVLACTCKKKETFTTSFCDTLFQYIINRFIHPIYEFYCLSISVTILIPL